MIRKATLMIAEAFDKRDIKYTIQEIGDETSVVDAGFGIACGPSAHILFASSDEENDVAIRITGLMQNIPSDKRAAMNEACNTINDKMRYLKFLTSAWRSVVSKSLSGRSRSCILSITFSRKQSIMKHTRGKRTQH